MATDRSKQKTDKAESRGQGKKEIKKNGMPLNDEELDMIAGGMPASHARKGRQGDQGLGYLGPL